MVISPNFAFFFPILIFFYIKNHGLDFFHSVVLFFGVAGIVPRCHSERPGAKRRGVEESTQCRQCQDYDSLRAAFGGCSLALRLRALAFDYVLRTSLRMTCGWMMVRLGIRRGRPHIGIVRFADTLIPHSALKNRPARKAAQHDHYSTEKDCKSTQFLHFYSFLPLAQRSLPQFMKFAVLKISFSVVL